MSLQELIAKRSHVDPPRFSLPELLATQALGQIKGEVGATGSPRVIEFFAAELLRPEIHHAHSYACHLRDAGVASSTLVEQYFVRTAQYLGERWADDTLSFAEVTGAMAQLTTLTREFQGNDLRSAGKGGNGLRAVLVATPNEEHTYGLMIAAHEMRLSGWHVDVDYTGNIDGITEEAARHNVDLIGFSLSCTRHVDETARCIERLRSQSLQAKFVLGGAITLHAPSAVEGIGADCVCNADQKISRSLEAIFNKDPD